MPATSLTQMARGAGALYLLIIVLGLTAEVGLRGGLLVPGDAMATGAAIAAGAQKLRLAIASDAVMALADVGLAVLLYRLLKDFGPTLALGATAFRLVQAAVIGASLPLLFAATVHAGTEAGAPLAAEALARHGFAYDMGLLFFGVNSVLTGLLIARTGRVGRTLGPLLIAAGAVYLAGSFLRILAPGAAEAFAPAYGICVISETAVCVWLLSGGAWRGQRSSGLAAA
ncbi:DUF4386 domain-containing protein [Histidinibacterium aquaticum]|uniref:DUF4386 domain-containing protein n=1 Tax=Histidinibacterium aquaticum TaxID=2613962 RepID=A0A5J5GDR8_9RHOB|nr:DUF4386 domain-containing protein [Histidinibacterium aquaticum]KAA9006028.1 DUF4386 domain-containing protein [Histidinibacterium aquaticum]